MKPNISDLEWALISILHKIRGPDCVYLVFHVNIDYERSFILRLRILCSDRFVSVCRSCGFSLCELFVCLFGRALNAQSTKSSTANRVTSSSRPFDSRNRLRSRTDRKRPADRSAIGNSFRLRESALFEVVSLVDRAGTDNSFEGVSLGDRTANSFP